MQQVVLTRPKGGQGKRWAVGSRRDLHLLSGARGGEGQLLSVLGWQLVATWPSTSHLLVPIKTKRSGRAKTGTSFKKCIVRQVTPPSQLLSGPLAIHTPHHNF